MLLGKCSPFASVVGTRPEGRLPPVLNCPPAHSCLSSPSAPRVAVASWSTEAQALSSEVLTNVVRKPLVQMFAEFKASFQSWSIARQECDS